MRNLAQVARRELRGYFGSPVAYLFMAAFLGVTLFVFFWVETFFVRNVANVTPLFKWMPLLLIFLVAAISMRGWSEERSSGTLELLLTAPRSNIELVLGKFFGCLGLVAVAVLLTLPIPITVSFMGPLDWGPVIGGYIATLLLASTYIALGLLISALTESQIVSLIGTLLIGLAFYFIGASEVTGLVSQQAADVLNALSTGARFDSISRGVVDLRDLIYYLSLTLLFLMLNVLVLERLRWSEKGGAKRHRRWAIAAALVAANLVALNAWLAPIRNLRADLTQGHIYSLSDTTVDYLHQLQQPLYIRGYFSKKTHPLLAPLVPKLKYLLFEYAERGGGNVKVQIVDPENNPQVAKEAASRYGITPVSFRTQSRYKSAVVNSYFDVLVQYGNQHKVLSFGDLIKIQRHGVTNLNVVLNDPEYTITSAIRKVVSKYRRGGNIFAAIKAPVTLHAFISDKARLPGKIDKLRDGFKQIVAQLKKKAGDKLVVNVSDPGDPGSAAAQKIAKVYGIQPLSTSLLGANPFFFNLVLERGDQRVPVALPSSLDKKDLERNIENGLTRFAPGLLNTIAVYTPPQPRRMRRLPGRRSKTFQTLKQALRGSAVVRRTNLESGHLPAGTDVLMVLAPDNLSSKQLFTIDQFLMRGGTTVIASSPYAVKIGPRGLFAHPRKTGLRQWLAAKGVHIGKSLVLDPHNARFPIPVTRTIGGVPVREYQETNYPYFVDVRQSGMPGDSVITGGLGQLTMTWASPIKLDKKMPGELHAQAILRSSDRSWVSDSTDVMPAPQGETPPWHAPPDGQRGSRILGTVVTGRFTSWFKDRNNPFLVAKKKPDAGEGKKDDKGSGIKLGTVISHSPANTRLVVLSSPSFADDFMMQLEGLGTGEPYVQPIKLIKNTVAWATQDPTLLALRGQSRVSRILQPMGDGQREFWEYLNYALAAFGLFVVFLIARGARRRRESWYLDELRTGNMQEGQV